MVYLGLPIENGDFPWLLNNQMVEIERYLEDYRTLVSCLWPWLSHL